MRMTYNYGLGAYEAVSYEMQVFIKKVFSIMAFGLGLTALSSYLTLEIPALLNLTVNIRWLLFIAEIGLVFYLANSAMKMDPGMAAVWFMGYSVLNGITLAPIFLIYTASSVASAFFVSACMFGVMAIWGSAAKKDLTSLGGILFMGLTGILIASIVNLFLQHTGFQMVISYAAVGVFTGLTAWDMQKIRYIGYNGEGTGGLAVIGALQLYLDFINLFMNILFIMGGRRNE